MSWRLKVSACVSHSDLSGTSCVGALIAGALLVLGGYGPVSTIVGLFFIIGVISAPF
jgi:hypothetical protein